MPDVIVAGAGHNGLVAAAYLAQAGLNVQIVEAYKTPGGMTSTTPVVSCQWNLVVKPSIRLSSIATLLHGGVPAAPSSTTRLLQPDVFVIRS